MRYTGFPGSSFFNSGAPISVSTPPTNDSGSPQALNHRRSLSGRRGRLKLVVGLLLGVVLILAAIAVGFVWFLMHWMKQADVVQDAMSRARSNPAVVQGLGVPIEAAWYVTGSISEIPTSGDADLAWPITGPKSKDTIYVTARKTAGTWQYSLLQVVVAGSNDKIDLLNPFSPTPQIDGKIASGYHLGIFSVPPPTYARAF